MKMVHAIMPALFVIVPSQTNASSGQQCALMSDDKSRLSCYDEVFGAGRRSGSSPPQSKWNVTSQKSKMDDSEIVNLSLDAEGYGGLVNIRCEESVTTIYFTLGGTFMADIESYGVVRYRIDALKQQRKSFQVSTDNEALGLWSGGSSIPFIKQLLGHSKLTVEMTGFNESASIKEFVIEGIDQAIIPLRQQCKW